MYSRDVLNPLQDRNQLAVTESRALTRANMGDSMIHNTGATGTVVIELPPGAAKYRCRFLRTAAQTMTIDPAGTEIIKGADGVSLGAGVAKDLTADGAFLDLEHDGAAWNVVGERPSPTGGLAAGALSADAAGRAIMAADYFGDEATVDAKFAAGVIDGDILKVGALSADATGRAVMATGLFSEAAATDKFAAGAIATGLLKAGAVTAPKLAPTGVVSGSFTGAAAAGACTLTGATVGQRVFSLVRTDAASGAVTTGQSDAFEATITVADQIQQSSASNLSAQTFAVVLLAAAA